jgi:hypothetical protein
MGIIPQYKIADCNQCGDKQVPCVKVGKKRKKRGKSQKWEENKAAIIKTLENEYIGKTIGRWTIISFAYQQDKKHGAIYFNCKCSCGKTKCRVLKSIVRGLSKSCGCFAVEQVKDKLKKYFNGEQGSKEYRAWADMKTRCYNKKRETYHRYGGRGIKVCSRWLSSFENFFEDMGLCPQGKNSLDRVRNNGNYCKSNCRWATSKEQSANTSKAINIKFKGKTQPLMQWALEIGISQSALGLRYRNGLRGEKLLFKGRYGKNYKIKQNG